MLLAPKKAFLDVFNKNLLVPQREFGFRFMEREESDVRCSPNICKGIVFFI